MNKEKLAIFIKLIDKAIQIAEERRAIMQTPEFYQKCKAAGWFSEEDIKLGKEYLENKYPYVFHYKILDENLLKNLKILKKQSESYEIEDDLIKYPKGHRGGMGFTRGISDCGHEMWGDSLYDYQIYDACGAVEDYYNKELE